MLVGDQDGVKGIETLPNRGEPFSQLPHTQPGVYQDARVFGRQKRRVTGTSAGQNTKTKNARPPWFPWLGLEYTDLWENRIGKKCLPAR